MKLRPATEADVPALESLLRRSWLSTWAPELSFETVRKWAAEDWAGAYARTQWADFLLADDNGKVLGMVHIDGNFIGALHVDHRHKRRGIGKVLMDEAERRIAAAGHDEATLETNTFNTVAIAFYEGRGWTKRHVFMGTDNGEPIETVAMAKKLRG
ncbi:MAG: GNAT family N-acetyltransferase [Alphaproteobacteria bacterium]|nr:GNAT family N-acetyltransferase [Alphaproteobacteria bacterium]